MKISHMGFFLKYKSINIKTRKKGGKPRETAMFLHQKFAINYGSIYTCVLRC